ITALEEPKHAHQVSHLLDTHNDGGACASVDGRVLGILVQHVAQLEEHPEGLGRIEVVVQRRHEPRAERTELVGQRRIAPRARREWSKYRASARSLTVRDWATAQ